MKIYPDATTLIALGEVGGLDLLTSLDGRLLLLGSVADEIDTEPARTNLSVHLDQSRILGVGIGDYLLQEVRNAKREAKEVLDEGGTNGDVAIVATVIQLKNKGMCSAVVSDDRRLRTVAEGLGARVTGTVGVVVRAVAEGELTEQEAKALVRRLDSTGLHMTGELREKADDLIEDAARENGDEE